MGIVLIVVIVGFLLTIMVVVGVIILVAESKVRKMKNPVLDVSGMSFSQDFTYFCYSKGGSSLGEYFSVTVQNNILYYVKCEGNGCPEIAKNRTLDGEIRTVVSMLLEESGMRGWKELPKTEYMALDGASTGFEVIFADGLDIRVENGDIPPAEGWKKVEEIVQLLEGYVR